MSTEDDFAIAIHNMLSNGMGGYDMAGLALWMEYFGVTDVDGLLMRLCVIKNYEPPKPVDPPK